MGFNINTGVYTPPAGATNATTGQVIQSAVWNTIHGDISNALTALGEGGICFPQKHMGFIDNVSLASVADFTVSIVSPTSIYWLPAIRVYNSGTVASLTTAAFGIFSGAGGTGTTIVPITAMSSITSNTVNVGNNFHDFGGAVNTAVNFTQLFFRVATVQAGAAVNVYFIGQGLP